MSLAAEFTRPDPHLFLIPAEELEPTGIRAPFAAGLVEAGTVSRAWVERFDAAFALYWRRALELAARAPRAFLPPRAPNVCVALDPLGVRPYFQPLGRSSYLLDHGDFEPATSSLELATYQFFHAERLNLVQAVVPALVHDLGYWLVRTREELEDFRAGCRRASAGRAPGWRALARSLEWIPQGFHEVLKPAGDAREPLVALAGTGFLLPRRLEPELGELQRRWREAAEQRTSAYFAAHATTRAEDPRALADWLAAERPLLLVTGRNGAILWDPEQPADGQRLVEALAGVTTAAAQALRRDWQVVGERSRAFLDALCSPEALPRPGPEIDQNGLAYVHRERRLIAYNVHEPGMQRLSEPSVPFERWMLAARTIHEWGHLAVEAGFLAVPAHRRAEFEELQGELAERFEAVVAGAPAALRAHAARQLAQLAARKGSAGRALVAQCLERMSDWQSNLLAQRFLRPVERETYVRNNVRPLLSELDSTQLFQALARYAFEYQYLLFEPGRDARRVFRACTWFAEQFLARGVLSEGQLEGLLEGVGRLCRCHALDEARFRPV